MDKNAIDASNAGGAILALPLELDHRLEDCARQEGTTKVLLALRAIEQYLEDLEDVSDAEQALRDFYASGEKAIPIEEVMRKYDLED
jgi:RHH-type rel operon transcriptional repressor/antitoxin RelB